MIFWWKDGWDEHWTVTNQFFVSGPIKFEIENDWHLHRGCLFFYEMSTDVRIWYLSCCRLYIPLFSNIIFNRFGLRCTHRQELCLFQFNFLFLGKTRWTHTRVEFGLHHQHWALYGALSSEVGSFFTEAYKCQKFLHISSVLTCWNMNLLSTMFCLYII